MSTPEIAFARFVTGLLLGCVLGIYYGFLRPIRRRRTFFPDLLFVMAAGWIYLHYGFAVCRGDLRMGYLAAPILGALAWDLTVGRYLMPIYAGFWRFLGGLLRPFQLFLKKICIFIKFLFATGKKWGTIKWKSRQQKKPHPEGVPHDRKEKPIPPYSAGILP